MEFGFVEKIAYERGNRVSNGVVYTSKGIPRKLRQNNNGYLVFSMTYGSRKDDSRRTYPVSVHRLLAYQKYGDSIYEEGIEVRHKDGNIFNFSSDNIIIGTHSDNMMDQNYKIREKKAIKASEKIRKFNDDEVTEIKLQRSKGASYKQLMLLWDISSKGTMNFIINNKYVTKK